MLERIRNVIFLIFPNSNDHLRSRDEHLFGMSHIETATVRQMNLERPERLGTNYLKKIFGIHSDDVAMSMSSQTLENVVQP